VPDDTRLYIDFELTTEATIARDVLAAVLDTAPIASVLLRSSPNSPLEADTARALIAMVQKKNVAALIAGDAAGISQLGADGIHLAWAPDIVSRFKEARRITPSGSIIGADAGKSRHDAMELGEAGAEYVAFGMSNLEDRSLAFERQLELISWWNEIFEVPSVAFDAADAEEARRLAEAGADFLSVAVRPELGVEENVSRLRAFASALALHEGAQ
jgi:thiamine-phosphate pyrophosphorylase